MFAGTEYAARLSCEENSYLSSRGKTTVDDFPRSRKGKRKYRTLEGLCWLSANSFVMVSDLAKAGYSKRCRKHDQSIHVFRLPKV